MQMQDFLEITHTHADTECLSSMQAAIQFIESRKRGHTALHEGAVVPLASYASVTHSMKTAFNMYRGT